LILSLNLEQVDDKLYIYLEYVSGGSIHKLLREYGQFGEIAIRNYTKQILSGLAYLHAKNTVHRFGFFFLSPSNLCNLSTEYFDFLCVWVKSNFILSIALLLFAST